MHGGREQSPAHDRQQEAPGKEADEWRAEDQAGGEGGVIAVLLQLKKERKKGERKKKKRPWWFLAQNPNLHLIWESFA